MDIEVSCEALRMANGSPIRVAQNAAYGEHNRQDSVEVFAFI